MHPPDQLAGQRFGRLLVKRFFDRTFSGLKRWKCVCDCGRSHIACGSNLKNGNTKSCGCLRSEITAERSRKRITHGQSYTAIYAVYRGMIARCYYSGAGSYCYYGGRGIRVCARWRGAKGFVNFTMDMGERPSDKYSIERKQLHKNYSPANCYWATAEQQAQNKRNTVHAVVDGERMSLRKACRLRGMVYDCALQRVWRGWSIERALNTPIGDT